MGRGERLGRVGHGDRQTVKDPRPPGRIHVAADGINALSRGNLRVTQHRIQLLPKLLESYAIDLIVIRKGGEDFRRDDGHRAAIDFFERVRRAGSSRTETPGSGAGIRTRAGGLLGDGVSLGGVLVHYGVQTEDRIVPQPGPKPIIIFPGPRQERR